MFFLKKLSIMQAALYLFASILLYTNAWAGTPMTETKPKVPYLDEQGQTQYVENYTLLTDETDFSDTLPGGWYVIEGYVSNHLLFNGDVHLILADSSDYSSWIKVNGNLNIYAQSTGKNMGEIINGNFDASKNITINGASVNVGYISAGGIIYINGGEVSSSKLSKSIIRNVSYLNLGWYSGRVCIAAGRALKDEKGNVYFGILNEKQFGSITDKFFTSIPILSFETGDPNVVVPIQEVNGNVPTKPMNITRKGFKFEGWFSDESYTTEFDFTQPLTQGAVAYAKWTNIEKIPYIDEKGEKKEITDYFYLTDSTAIETDSRRPLPGGWYVIEGEIKPDGELIFKDDVNLILADNAKLSLKDNIENIRYLSPRKFDVWGNLNIFAQSTGKNRGQISLTDVYTGISAYNVSINGGEIVATIPYDEVSNCIDADSIFINGGSVIATADLKAEGIVIKGLVDSLKARSFHNIYNNSIYYEESTTVSIGDDLILKDEDGLIYAGTLSMRQISTLAGKTLKSYSGHALSFVTGDPSITIPAQDVSDKLPTKPTNITRKGFKLEGWFTDESYTTEFDFTKPLTRNAIAYAKWSNIKKIPYIDENGKTKEISEYFYLTDSTETEYLPGGWYVVEGKVSYKNRLKFTDEANLIIVDGAKLSVESDRNTIDVGEEHNLNIYAQSTEKNKGEFYATCLGDYGIEVSHLTINGVRFISQCSISADTISIHKADFTALDFVASSNFIINEGSVVTIDRLAAFKIFINGCVDSLKVDQYIDIVGEAINYEPMHIADGLILQDEDGLIYAGTLSMRQIYTLAGKTLKSYSGHALSFVTGDPNITIPAQDISDKLPTKPTITRKGFKLEGWFTDESYTVEFDFTQPLTQNTTVYAKWTNIEKIPYIDENGVKKELTDYFYLTDSTELDYRPESWYVVEGNVSYKRLLEAGDVNLVIVDGAKLSIVLDKPPNTELNLNIYAQSTGKNRGEFYDARLDGLYESPYSNVYFMVSSLSINGVRFIAKDIYADEISVRSADFTSPNIFSSKFTINEGSIVSIGTLFAHNIFVNGYVDNLKVDDYHVFLSSLHIADGLILQDEDGNVYTGTFEEEQIVALNGKTLKAFADSTTTIEKKALPMAGNLEISYANDQLSINGSKGSEIKVAVFDMMGNLAESSRGSGSRMTIPLKHLNRGTYVVRVSAGRTMRTLRILVK